MGAQEIAAGIQFLVDSQGQVTSVLVSADTWKRLVNQLENAEDRSLLMQLAPKLAEGPASALRWTEVEQDWS